MMKKVIKIKAIHTVQSSNESFTFLDVKVFLELFYGVNAALSCWTYWGEENVPWGVPSTLPWGTTWRAHLVTTTKIDILGWNLWIHVEFCQKVGWVPIEFLYSGAWALRISKMAVTSIEFNWPILSGFCARFTQFLSLFFIFKPDILHALPC